MTTVKRNLSTLLLVSLAAACASSGLGEASRKDVRARMEGARGPIASCYEAALKIDGKTAGKMVVAFTAKAGSGQFIDVTIKEDEIGNPDLQTCVIEKISALKLAKPTKTALAVEYPLTFRPAR